ncbi:MAG: hypothetical protein NTX79_00475 [Candidatus Micrarchaeota archaeon]|nr:hypothetical protein [Candidatus Micrarchaeota archaeon]
MNKAVKSIVLNKNNRARPWKVLGLAPLAVGIIVAVSQKTYSKTNITIPAGVEISFQPSTNARLPILTELPRDSTLKIVPKKGGLKVLGNHGRDMKNIQVNQKIVKGDQVVVFYEDGSVKPRIVKNVESTFDKAVFTFKGGETDDKVSAMVKVYVGMTVTIVTPDEKGKNISVGGKILEIGDKDTGGIKLNSMEMGGIVLIPYESIVSITRSQ